MKIFPYVRIPPWHLWKQPRVLLGDGIGLFRNRPGVIPGRWGFYVFGFEVGSRSPGDPVGVWLKGHGLWPW